MFDEPLPWHFPQFYRANCRATLHGSTQKYDPVNWVETSPTGSLLDILGYEHYLLCKAQAQPFQDAQPQAGEGKSTSRFTL